MLTKLKNLIRLRKINKFWKKIDKEFEKDVKNRKG